VRRRPLSIGGKAVGPSWVLKKNPQAGRHAHFAAIASLARAAKCSRFHCPKSVIILENKYLNLIVANLCRSILSPKFDALRIFILSGNSSD
jgi:hypothetical protein